MTHIDDEQEALKGLDEEAWQAYWENKDPEYKARRAQWAQDDAYVPEEVTFCRKYCPDMPVEECFEAYRVYRSYVDEGQSREVARMYAGLS